MKKKSNMKISYDKESGVFSMDFGKSKSFDSDINGNVVIDYDKNGKIVRMNIYGFSFSDFENGKKAIREFSRIEKVSMPSANL